MTSISFRGGKDLEKALTRLPEHVERKVATKANRAGAAYFRKRLIERLPRGTTKVYPTAKQRKPLSQSIAIRKIRGRAITHHVGVVGWARAYAHIDEFGSKYQAPNPTWRRTLETESQNILQAVADELRKGIEAF